MSTVELEIAQARSTFESEVPDFLEAERDEIVAITNAELAGMISCYYANPLPDAAVMFPWLHGSDNHGANLFFRDRHNCVHKDNDCVCLDPPTGIRGLLLVEVGGEFNVTPGLLGAVTPQDVLESDRTKNASGPGYLPRFLKKVQRYDLNLRNFQSQPARFAQICDIIVYSFDPTASAAVMAVAQALKGAQREFKISHPSIPNYDVMIYLGSPTDPSHLPLSDFSVHFERSIYDPFQSKRMYETTDTIIGEKLRVLSVSMASSLGVHDPKCGNLWIGNSKDHQHYMVFRNVTQLSALPEDHAFHSRSWNTFVKCVFIPDLPGLNLLDQKIRQVNLQLNGTLAVDEFSCEFFASDGLLVGEISDTLAASILNLCKLIYLRSKHDPNRPKSGTLVFATDGYRGSALFSLLYIVYSTGVDTATALLDLHRKFDRTFACTREDIATVYFLTPLLHEYSPAINTSKYRVNLGAVPMNDVGIAYRSLMPPHSIIEVPINMEQFQTEILYPETHAWLNKFNGVFPSRILPYLYLGSLEEANNAEVLKQLGIKRILSVGEMVEWLDISAYSAQTSVPNNTAAVYNFPEPYSGIEELCYVDKIQDDGVDSIDLHLEQCLKFLQKSYEQGVPTLVHCRVGVSRSASICIAEVMKRFNTSLRDAYLHVRSHRLNVIIQPNLRLMYDLLKWEEYRTGRGRLRVLDWPRLCRDIALMNSTYV